MRRVGVVSVGQLIILTIKKLLWKSRMAHFAELPRRLLDERE